MTERQTRRQSKTMSERVAEAESNIAQCNSTNLEVSTQLKTITERAEHAEHEVVRTKADLVACETKNSEVNTQLQTMSAKVTDAESQGLSSNAQIQQKQQQLNTYTEIMDCISDVSKCTELCSLFKREPSEYLSVMVVNTSNTVPVLHLHTACETALSVYDKGSVSCNGSVNTTKFTLVSKTEDEASKYCTEILGASKGDCLDPIPCHN